MGLRKMLTTLISATFVSLSTVSAVCCGYNVFIKQVLYFDIIKKTALFIHWFFCCCEFSEMMKTKQNWIEEEERNSRRGRDNNIKRHKTRPINNVIIISSFMERFCFCWHDLVCSLFKFPIKWTIEDGSWRLEGGY